MTSKLVSRFIHSASYSCTTRYRKQESKPKLSNCRQNHVLTKRQPTFLASQETRTRGTEAASCTGLKQQSEPTLKQMYSLPGILTLPRSEYSLLPRSEYNGKLSLSPSALSPISQGFSFQIQMGENRNSMNEVLLDGISSYSSSGSLTSKCWK